ncbi:NADH-quinone oxidoreductase subunit L [Sphingobacterium psychroaquaticum]|uniref:NADH-quinone oxidoreductase subunit L n=1 Tax=Sphingobacterium psychroaquaticum TaxID=561061 RepID=UPI001F2B2B5C|nr:NADH-quinone oxidoreductase subunit L [Sphingobacterium psychroaquaticum]
MTNISPIHISILVVLLPFLAFLTQAIVGKKDQSGNIGLIAIILSTVCSLVGVFMEVWNHIPMYERIHWFTIGGKSFHVGILLNNLTTLMQLVVCIVALPVHIYSRAYMKSDPGIHRYWMYLSLFCFAMLGLTVSINLLQLYIFWELVGFASYLLIGFWFTKDSAVQANKKAFIINRIGDLGFLVGIALLYSQLGSIDLVELFGKEGLIYTMDTHATWVTYAGLAFFLGAMAKSAQFPLHVWLPDAMEGPTSVSSLIHAATMVAAGVFLLCTVFPLFNETVLAVITIIGCLTAILAAFFALPQYDIKKILAFSTISQLGFMMVAVGIGAWDAAMFHLTTHAFFKCLLFLGAGAVIHEMTHLKEQTNATFDPQDLRTMGGLRHHMPKTFVLMVIASLALAGFPLTSGYLSKDSIVISAFEWASQYGGLYFIVPTFLIFVSILTAFYIGRLLFKAFFGPYNYTAKVHDAPSTMLYPMLFLGSCSLFFAFSWQPLDYHASWLMEAFHVKKSFATVDIAHIIIPSVLTLGALVTWAIGWQWYVKSKYPFATEGRWMTFFREQGYINQLYAFTFVKGTVYLSTVLFWFDKNIVDGCTKLLATVVRELARVADWFDKNIVDGLVNVIARFTYYLGHLVRQVQNGQLQGYLGFALTIVVLGILYLIIK